MVSEMLGNQYFLARNYPNAVRSFQQSLLENPSNKSVRKKLIICYTQVGEIYKALGVFQNLVKEDVKYIIDTDIKEDYCPCPDLIEKYGKDFPFESYSTDLRLLLAMLWLYCNAEKSLSLFKGLLKDDVKIDKIKSIIESIETSLKSNQLMNNQSNYLKER